MDVRKGCRMKTEREEVIRQMREAQEETSATMALDSRALPMFEGGQGAREAQGLQGLQGQQGEGVAQEQSLGTRWRTFRTRLFVTVLVVASLSFGGWSTYQAYFARPTAATFVTGVKDIAQLATAEAYVTTTVEGQDNKLLGMEIPIDLPGTKRHYLMLIPAKMLAGVDLQQVGEDDLLIDHGTKTIQITLPHAAFLQESIQMEQVKLFTSDGLLRSSLNAQESIDILAQHGVIERLRSEASASGLLETAERNAENVLRSLYREFGYQVKVIFR